MIPTYFKIAWRNLVKSKGYSAINIGGLTIGMAVAMLIGLWIQDELSYNKNHKNYDRIAQVMQHATFNGTTESQVSNPAVMGPELRAKYGSHFKYVVQMSWQGEDLITYENKPFKKHSIFMEPDGPEMLTLDMIAGSRKGLTDPYSILLSASTAKTLFGNDDPLNKVVKFSRTHDVKVTGIYKDLPANSSFSSVQIILPWSLWEIQNPWSKQLNNPWSSNFSQTFVQIADNADMAKVSAAIVNVKTNNIGPEEKRYNWKAFLQPMSKWNLYNEFKNGVNTGGNIRYVWLFGLIGIFVLVLACINFMNLSTARSEKRAREVGIRKTIGSLRWQLIRQFITESYVVVLCAFVLSLVVVALLLPVFNEVSGKKMTMPLSNGLFWIASILFMLVTGLLAGSYPAFYLSSFKPLKVLKGTFKVGKSAAIPRKILVVTQFTVSVGLIIGTVIIHQQVQHAKDRPIGYTRSGLISMGLEDEIRKHFDAVKTELINAGAIENMAASNSPMTGVWNTNGGFDWEGKDPSLAVDFPNNRVSYDYGKTVKWTIKEGRDFSTEFATDSAAFIINESAAKFLNMGDPVGKTLKWEDQPFTIIGIVKDIMQESPYYPVRPTLYHIGDLGGMFHVIMRLNPNKSASASIARIEKAIKARTPDVPFTYDFVDETYGSKFTAEERIGKLSSYFAVLAIFISCLGLFGLSGFVAEQRTKEIGIRKVLGASVSNLWKLLSIEFVILVVISCALAAPLAYYFLDGWLTNYDYRITIGWGVFVFASFVAVIITLLTVSVLTVKAALANPVKSLRTE